MRVVAAVLMPAALCCLIIQPTSAQDRAQAPKGQEVQQDQGEEERPTPAPLSVGSMALASSAVLSVEAMAVDVSIDRVTYTYRLKNAGKAELSLEASVSEPDLEVSSDGTTTYDLPSDKADNIVGLDVTANGRAIAITSDVQAIALGRDRRQELVSAGIPLVPFGEATDKALAAAKPETLARLEGLGLITPRDASQPDAQVVADWSLHVVHGWTLKLGPMASTDVHVAFAPIKAVYTIDASSLAQFDALKDAACLTPQFMGSVKALLAAKGSTVDVADILVANEGPTRWLETPPVHVAVRKPTPDSLVSFCGLDPKAQKAATVTGAGSAAGSDVLRILIFARNDGP